MPVKLEDRPIEQVREETVDKLIINYSHAIISAEAFERRLDDAMATDSHQQLVELVEDLPLEADASYDAKKERSFTPNYGAGEESQDDKLVSILGSSVREGQWVVPKKINVVDVLGSTKIDFTDAIFQHQNIEVNVANVLGSLEIFVPESVNVTIRMYDIVGSSENKAPSMAGRQAPQITITGYSVLGSVEVSVKQTMKEKFVAFANSMREALGMSKNS
ncbi:Cell wall-active antibiotics response 4TMS YvqF [Pseudidiomarina maritima]|uniref:Cell wall-active antibiotics response 4TMS YvqF n=1 Tax=Pseudidiomarina maritima TaxID=519453 RepID=A0A1I6HWK6_9GAMM|nr:LiaF domain-containing protein [Pseudidiomarina maritima]SFR58841.1 Cell wall-active antibiotics response 4TMS YvqF [Pseudidiomarina maritima]